MIKTLNEYGKLKNLILNEDQVSIFNFTSKQYLSPNQIKDDLVLNGANIGLTKEKLFDLVNSFLENRKIFDNDIDSKLSKMLKNEIKLKYIH